MMIGFIAILIVSGAAFADEDVDIVSKPACQREHDRIQDMINEFIENTGEIPVGMQKPQCAEDGTYAPRQCMHAVCRCVAPDGTILTEQDFGIGQAKDTDCSCARAKYDYEQLRIIGKMFRCTDIGSYDPIQCTGSVCYCADARGEQNGEGVNISEIDSLNC